MITEKQQEILDSIESEASRDHYRAQFEMQNELGENVPAGGIFDAPVAGGNMVGFFQDNDRMVQRAELLSGRAEEEDLLGSAPDRELDDAELAAGLSADPRVAAEAAAMRETGRTQELRRPPPDDPLVAPLPKEVERVFNVGLVVIVALVLAALALAWWFSK